MSETPDTYAARPSIDFDAVTHTYTCCGAVYPSVTQILKAVMPVIYHGATEWHMARGTIVHECAAMIARGIRFVNDPQIDGEVAACRAWFAMRKPVVHSVERRVWRCAPIQYAGTLDLLCEIRGALWIVDWKGSASPRDQWQLGGYADALADEGIEVRHGMVVVLDDGGKPKEGKAVDLRRARNEWRSILNVYAMRKREGILE
jgi:hypothetical protein